MTTDAGSTEIIIEYEAAVPKLNGADAADFQIRRESHAILECALYLALDARQAFEARCGELSDDQAQDLLRAIAAAWYPAVMAGGAEPPPIYTLRARELTDELIDSTIAAAGLPTLPTESND